MTSRNFSFGNPPSAGANWRSQHLSGNQSRKLVHALKKEGTNRMKANHTDQIKQARLNAMREQTTEKFNRELREASNWHPKAPTRGLDRSTSDPFELTFGPRYLDTLRKTQSGLSRPSTAAGSSTRDTTTVRQCKWAGFDHQVRPKSAQPFSTATAKIITRQVPGKRVACNPGWNQPVPFKGYAQADASNQQGFSNTRARRPVNEVKSSRAQLKHLRDIQTQRNSGNAARLRDTQPFGNSKLLETSRSSTHKKRQQVAGWTTTSGGLGGGAGAPSHETKKKQSWYGLSANERNAFHNSRAMAGHTLTGERARLATMRAQGRANMLQIPRHTTAVKRQSSFTASFHRT